MKNKKGVTLIELIVTLAILGIIIPVIYSVFFAGVTSYSFSTNKGFAQQDLRRTADYLTNELRLMTDITNEDLNSTEYYSLRINSEGNLVKSKHVQQTDDSISTSIINTIHGHWSSIHLTNDTSGVINIQLKQIENSGSKDASYDLSQSIITVNSPDMLNNLNIDLVNGDVLYFQNTKSLTLANDIYLSKPSESGDSNIIVSFYNNYGENLLYQRISGLGGVKVNLPNPPARSGFYFLGWTTISDGSGIKYGTFGNTTFNMPTMNMDLFARWIETSDVGNLKIDTSTTEGKDGIISIGGQTPKKTGNYFYVTKNVGSDVTIKLSDYTSLYQGFVNIIVNNTNIAIENNDLITFKAIPPQNGSNKTFDVEVIIKMGDFYTYKKKYSFITN